MKCDEFRDNVWRLIEDANGNEMRAHMEECPACAEYYRQVRATVEGLTPSALPSPPESLAGGVLSRVRADRRRNLRRRISRVAAAVLVVGLVTGAALLMGTPNNARAAGRLIAGSIERLGNVATMRISFNMRTQPQENFSYIEADARMQPHVLTVELDGRRRWRLDKPLRSAMYDGEKYYMMIHNVREGYVSRDAGFIDDMELLLDPYAILATEKRIAASDKNAKYKITESGDQIRMSVEAKAKGDFTNDYLLNSTVEESDNIREYVFDSSTNLMESMKIYIMDEGRKVLVMDVDAVEYDVPIDEVLFAGVPEGYVWNDADAIPANPRFSGVTAEKAARMIMEALTSSNAEMLKDVLNPMEIDRLMQRYAGARVQYIGESFRSGTYGGVFVPVRVEFADGTVEERKMALRNDNPNGVWCVDGGIV